MSHDPSCPARFPDTGAECVCTEGVILKLRERVAALEKRRDELDAGWDKAVAEVLLLRAVVAAADAMLENMHEWPAGLYAYNTARAALKDKP